MNKRYCISPSLINMYTYMRDHCETLEDAQIKKQEILDYINGVEREEPAAAARGTAFNELVDYLTDYDLNELLDHSVLHNETTLTQDYHGKTYLYSPVNAIAKVVDRVKDMAKQEYVSAHFDVMGADVELHGYPDYIGLTEVVDLKTTKTFATDKYEAGWQHHVYPVILVGSGMMQKVDTFTYLVCEMIETKDGVNFINSVYPYSIPFDYRRSFNAIYDVLAYDLLPWIEEHRSLITRGKIFGEE